MREIKFRAWDKEYENMFHNAYPFEHLVYVEMFDDDETFERFKHKMQIVNGKYFYFIVAKDIELMQYTGCKDKNGKDIYEGDIVQWPGADMRTHAPIIYKREVIYDTDAAMFLPNSMKGEVEVIGNIYENSELLERI